MTENKKRTISTQVDADLLVKIDTMAAAQEYATRAKIINKILCSYFEQQEAEGEKE